MHLPAQKKPKHREFIIEVVCEHEIHLLKKRRIFFFRLTLLDTKIHPLNRVLEYPRQYCASSSLHSVARKAG